MVYRVPTIGLGGATAVPPVHGRPAARPGSPGGGDGSGTGAGPGAPRDPELRGGTVAIDMPNAYEVCQELLRRDVLVDFRPRAGVRFSPHFYNTLPEIDRAIQTVDEILSEMGVAAR